MKYFSPLSLYDYTLKCSGNVIFIDVGTKKSGFYVADNHKGDPSKKRVLGVKPLLSSSVKPFKVLWHYDNSIDEVSYVLDDVATKHDVCGFYFGHPDVNKMYRRQGKEVSGFEPRKSSSSPLEREEYRPAAPLVRRYSISAASVSPHSSDVSKQALATKYDLDHVVVSCIDNTCITFSERLAKEDYLELRQEVNDLLEYSNAKLDRVTRYLGVLAEKTCKIKLPLKPKLEYLH
ncbi:hypothetical protein LWI29_010767 [Acer saccharum]|uniref:Uncharacterized protein n=1 Tax=Acer saccharum TaxID=4024 RepID=A0AA39W670_ACESA|nr:hypothetical protein LWI29_010767 [Acer saccharum]